MFFPFDHKKVCPIQVYSIRRADVFRCEQKGMPNTGKLNRPNTGKISKISKKSQKNAKNHKKSQKIPQNPKK